MSRCQLELKAAGAAYPRTCPTCGLSGACVKGLSHGQPKRPQMPADMTREGLAARGAPEPLPCPFCGSPAKTFWFDGALQATCPKPYVECAASDVVAPVAMWNRRAPLAASPEVQALIREAEARVWERAVEAVQGQQLPSEPSDGDFERGAAQGVHDCLCAIRAEAAAIRGEGK